ncbi:hypothetical protein SKAU_G00429180, partial [Synaphobranchus kaupii]
FNLTSYSIRQTGLDNTGKRREERNFSTCVFVRVALGVSTRAFYFQHHHLPQEERRNLCTRSAILSAQPSLLFSSWGSRGATSIRFLSSIILHARAIFYYSYFFFIQGREDTSLYLENIHYIEKIQQINCTIFL